VSGGSEDLKENGASLARDARIIFEKLVRGLFCCKHFFPIYLANNRLTKSTLETRIFSIVFEQNPKI